MINQTLDQIFDIDASYTLCPKCGVVEPCLVHQPLPEGVNAGEIVTIVPPDLGAPVITITPANTTLAAPSTPPDVAELEDDFESARQKIKGLMDTGRDATEKSLELAQSGDSPRAYEVVGTLITATVNASKALIDLHQTRKDIKTPSSSAIPSPGTVNIDKAVFVGRASDLIRELVNAKKKPELPE